MFSIVIPLYNKSREILRTIGSILSQSYSDFEVIIVDDGSTDDGADKVSSIKDERIRLLRKENGGVCSARNAGIKAAKGDLIALLDADDEWDRDYLLEQSLLIEDFPQCSLWGINFAATIGGKFAERIPTGLPDGFRGTVENYFNIPGRISDLFCSSSVVIRKDVFEEVGYFDERLKYSEDIDMWWRIIAGHPVAFYDRFMVFYHYDASNRAMKRTRALKYWLPNYPEKYASFKGREPFYTWVQRWCAVKLKEVYFLDKNQRADAFKAAGKLDYSVLPAKYRLYFKLPFAIGSLVYKIKP